MQYFRGNLARALAPFVALLLALFTCAASAQTDLRHMRGVNATSNYGTNEAGFKRPTLTAPSALAAARVQVSISRSTGNGTWDLAAVSLQGVTLGAHSLAQAGFWLSRNADTGQLSLAFNPSIDASLAAVAGFSGDINLPRTPDGSFVDLSQLSRASGVAREFVVAVIHHAPALLAGATWQINNPASSLNASTTAPYLREMTSAILAADDRRAGYFAYLRSMHVEWIALTVPIFSDSIADPVVRVKYRPASDTGATVYTMADEDLEDFLKAAEAAGFKTALGFEFYPVILPVSGASPGCGTSAYKPNRWLLGQPEVASPEADAQCINPADWWWNPTHPSHAANVAAFFTSLTQVEANYARIAQRSGVDLMVLGTEMDNLFRTRTGAAPYTNHFLNELRQLVTAVRTEFTGLVSVEMLWSTFAHPEWMAGGRGTAAVWSAVYQDLGMDFVALSAYYPLASAPVTGVMTVAQLESAWEQVFTQHLLPLKAANPGKALVLTEWGYTNDVNAPFVQGSRLGEPAATGDAGGAQQANIIEAFFNVNARHGDAVQGPFLYGVNFPDALDCSRVTFGVYCKPGTQVLADAYGAWMRADADRVFAWAERNFPAVLSGPGSSGTMAGYYYRHYPAANTYVGVKDGRVYVHDGVNWVMQDMDALRTFLDWAGQQGF